MHPADLHSVDRVSVEELIRAYEQARRHLPQLYRSSTLAELSPAAAAGALVEEHGLPIAKLLARSRVDHLPPSWEYEFLTWQLLDAARAEPAPAAGAR